MVKFVSRRKFLNATALSVRAVQAGLGGKIQAVAFDAFPIFDPRPLVSLVNELYSEKGAELGALWHTRQFEYAWLRSMSGRYADFRQVTSDALVFAARATGVDLTAEKQDRLMDGYLNLRCWPDVPQVLLYLKKAGIRIAFLSNLTGSMLEAGIRNSKLNGLFDYVLSTDRVKAYKPDPRAYQMGLDAFGLKPEQILFAAFAGWDVAGARSFGYKTFWVNRQSQPFEELGYAPHARIDKCNTSQRQQIPEERRTTASLFWLGGARFSRLGDVCSES
jgi:2-haloacid dehalogenase